MKNILILLVSVVVSLTASASSEHDIREKLKGKLKNSKIDHVSESPINGLYEIQTGQNIIYYHVDNDLFIFGEIYTTKGKSLTSESMKMVNSRILNSHLDKGLTIGDKNSVNHIIEFTDPDCPFCRKYDQFITNTNESLKRTVFFSADLHPSARPKIEHLICLDDPDQREKDMKRIMSGDVFDYLTCDKASLVISDHREIARKLRVTGTPTLFVNNVRVTGGANLKAVSNLLIKTEGTKDNEET